jgi:hypothetical protein
MNVIVIQIYKITIFKRDLNTIPLSYIRMFNYYIFIICGIDLHSVSDTCYNIIFLHITNIMKYVLLVTKYNKKSIRNLLLKKLLKNVINITHDNFNMQMSPKKNKCKQIIAKYSKLKICIQFQ